MMCISDAPKATVSQHAKLLLNIAFHQLLAIAKAARATVTACPGLDRHWQHSHAPKHESLV